MASKKMGADGLNDRRRRFAEEYVKDLNATQAARRAGYTGSDTSVSRTGALLVGNAAVQQAIQARQRKGIQATDLTVERVLREIARIGLADPRRMYATDGTLIPIHMLDDDSAAAVASYEHETTTKGGADDDPAVQRTLRKLKVWDKVSALTLAARYHGLLRDNVALTGTVQTDVRYTANMPPRGIEDDSGDRG